MSFIINPHRFVSAIIDNVLEFDGANDKVTFTNTTAYAEACLIFDFQTDDISTFSSILCNDLSVTPNVGITSTRIKALSFGAGRDFNFPSHTENFWHRIILTTSTVNTEGRCYRDGIESISSPLGELEFDYGFMGQYFNGINPHGGKIDNVILLDVLPTAGQLVSLNNDPSFALTDMAANVRRAYRMNSKGTSTTAIDEGLDEENGLLVNFTGTYWTPR